MGQVAWLENLLVWAHARSLFPGGPIRCSLSLSCYRYKEVVRLIRTQPPQHSYLVLFPDFFTQIGNRACCLLAANILGRVVLLQALIIGKVLSDNGN